MSKTVPFQTIQFRVSMQFCSIWPIDWTLSGATIPGQSGTGSDGNEGVLHIPQSSSITGTSPSDCFAIYPEHSFAGGGLTVSVFYCQSRLGKERVVGIANFYCESNQNLIFPYHTLNQFFFFSFSDLGIN